VLFATGTERVDRGGAVQATDFDKVPRFLFAEKLTQVALYQLFNLVTRLPAVSFAFGLIGEWSPPLPLLLI